jgi:hypothetical protein
MRLYQLLKESTAQWMSDTQLDEYVPEELIDEWRELVGYNEDGIAHPLWVNMSGHYDPDISDPGDRSMMVKVANKWAKMKGMPVTFYDVRDADDELNWLVDINS